MLKIRLTFSMVNAWDSRSIFGIKKINVDYFITFSYL